MLKIDIIENKVNRIDEKTNEEVLDLLSSVYSTKNIKFELKNIAIVSKEMEMRPDLLAFTYLGNSAALGTILKLNNISNPLSLEAGEVIFIPTQTTIDKLFETIPKANNTEISNNEKFRKKIQEKISQVSKERLDYLNSKNISNLSQTPLPPNILQEGEEQVLLEDNKLILGPNIGVCKNKPNKKISIADIKSKLVQKNIFDK